ncbi:hypothetical protein Tco_0389670 [Tanacetum coccineum]
MITSTRHVDKGFSGVSIVVTRWRWSLTVIEVVRSGGDDVGVEMAAVVVAADKDGSGDCTMVVAAKEVVTRWWGGVGWMMVWWQRRLVKDGGNDDRVMWCVAWWRWWSLEHSRNLTEKRGGTRTPGK